jgi:hypothetical protein
VDLACGVPPDEAKLNFQQEGSKPNRGLLKTLGNFEWKNSRMEKHQTLVMVAPSLKEASKLRAFRQIHILTQEVLEQQKWSSSLAMNELERPSGISRLPNA